MLGARLGMHRRRQCMAHCEAVAMLNVPASGTLWSSSGRAWARGATVRRGLTFDWPMSTTDWTLDVVSIPTLLGCGLLHR